MATRKDPSKLLVSQLTPEFEFLCAVLRTIPHVERAQALANETLNWETIYQLSAGHSVRPRLLKMLRQCQFGQLAAIPIERLEAFQRHHAMQNLQFAAELIRVAGELTKAQIKFAVFKGVSLAGTLYGDLAGREFNDLDVIVDPAEIDSVVEILAQCGYQPRIPDPAFRRAFLAYQQQYMFVHQSSRIVIDLHWGFVTKGVPFPIAPQEIWAARRNFNIAGRGIPTLGNADLALFLAGHGLKEGWKSLSWVLDFALLIDRFDDIDWVALHHRATSRGCGRTILVSLLLASRLFNANADPHLVDLALKDQTTVAICLEAIERMQKQAYRENLDELMGSFGLCETWNQKLRVAFRLAFTRTTGDYEALPLPRMLWRAYHLTRPIRLTARAMRTTK